MVAPGRTPALETRGIQPSEERDQILVEMPRNLLSTFLTPQGKWPEQRRAAHETQERRQDPNPSLWSTRLLFVRRSPVIVAGCYRPLTNRRAAKAARPAIARIAGAFHVFWEGFLPGLRSPGYIRTRLRRPFIGMRYYDVARDRRSILDH